MTDQEQLVAPAAPASAQAGDAAPAADDTAPPDPTKKLRDKMAEQGRQLQDAQRLLQAQTSQIADLQEQIRRQGSTLTQMEQARVNAYLDSIDDPGMRAVEELKILKRQLQTAGSPRPVQQTRQPSATGETPEQYQARRSKEILAEVNSRYGTNITGNETDDDEDPLLDYSSEDAFKASARALAATLKKVVPQETPVAKKSSESAAASSSQPTESRQSSPAAPRPVANPRNLPLDSGQLNEFVSTSLSGHGRMSPVAMRKALKEKREQAAGRLPK